MKVLTPLLVLVTQLCCAQTLDLDSCGTNSKAGLNTYEIQYFKEVLQVQLGGVHWSDVKVAYGKSNYGKDRITKKNYFDTWGTKVL